MVDHDGSGTETAPFFTRPATPEDIPALWDIDQQCFEPDIAYPPDIFFFYLLIQRDPAFVAMDAKGTVIGFVITSRERRRRGTVVTIDILSPWRGRGVGSRLILLAEDAMKAQGVTRMRLQTAVGNNSAVSFYEKHRYRKAGTIKDYYGPGKDAFQFEKRLDG